MQCIRNCSLADSALPKANTRGPRAFYPIARSIHGFNDLHAAFGLARQVPLQMQESRWERRGFQNQIGNQEIDMFDGKNNRLLDSFAFRLVLTAAVFAVWSGAGYVLLSLV